GLPEDSEIDYANVQGNKGRALLDKIHIDTGFQLSKRIRISVEQRFYFRKTHYAYFDDVITSASENRIKITCNLIK
ncbi:MAG: hypothetical protein LBQ01_08635, partial [Prevotellaceae bacterium]|nr:hypothetical protein [Prevotellaceae bacterium]